MLLNKFSLFFRNISFLQVALNRNSLSVTGFLLLSSLLVGSLGHSQEFSNAANSRVSVRLSSQNLWGIGLKELNQGGSSQSYLRISYMSESNPSAIVSIASIPGVKIDYNLVRSLRSEVEFGSSVKLDCLPQGSLQVLTCDRPQVKRPKDWQWKGPGRFLVPRINEAFRYVIEF